MSPKSNSSSGGTLAGITTRTPRRVPNRGSPNGGWTTDTGGGRYADADLNGLRQLAANYGR
ncbi:hypothetical protein GCM10010278_84790 [Streptomyces melanogenes]|nr:hypothetical protein GCM10010278_84790 [Streptomyces melanogenes]